MQSIDVAEKYIYGTRSDIIYVKEKIKSYNILQTCFTSIVLQKKNKKHNPNWP